MQVCAVFVIWTSRLKAIQQNLPEYHSYFYHNVNNNSTTTRTTTTATKAATNPNKLYKDKTEWSDKAQNEFAFNYARCEAVEKKVKNSKKKSE